VQAISQFFERIESMNPVQAKVSSVIRFPVPPGWSVSSSDPSVVVATITGNVLILTAMRAGNAVLSLKPFADLGVVLAVSVTA
jgi:hypothetical protein